MRIQIGKSGLAIDRERALHDAGELMGELHRQPFKDVDHAENGVRADPINRVVAVSHHDLGGDAGLAIGDGIGIAAHGADIVENPFFVAALFVHVLDKTVLIARIAGLGRRQGQQREGMLHMVISLSQEVDIKLARAARDEGLLHERDGQKAVPGFGRLQIKSFICAHSITSRVLPDSEIFALSCRIFAASPRLTRPFAVKSPSRIASSGAMTKAPFGRA